MYGDLPEGLPLTDLDLGSLETPLEDLDFGPDPVGVYEPHDIVDLPMDDMDPRDNYLQYGEYVTIPPGTTYEDSGNVEYPDWVVEAADEACNSLIEGTDELQDALGDFLGF